MWCEGTLPRHLANTNHGLRAPSPVTCHACDLCAYRRVGRSTVYTLQRLAYTAEVVVRERCVGGLRTRAERCHTAAACSGGGAWPPADGSASSAGSRWAGRAGAVRPLAGRPQAPGTRACAARAGQSGGQLQLPAAARSPQPCGRTGIDAAGLGCGLSGLCVGDTTTNLPWTGGTHSAGAPKPPSK